MATAAQNNARLGRGLASLIGDPAKTATQKLPSEGEQRVVAVDQVRPSALNPRHTFREEDLEELANSLREKGLIQPLIVRPVKGLPSDYEIVAGERRWRAAQKAGLLRIPVIVRDLGDREVLELAIIENVQRADLNPLEEALGYQELISRYDYTQEDLAQTIGKSRSHLANTLRLLKLPEPVQTMVRETRLSAGHARALIGRDDAETIARDVLEKGMSVRDVEAFVQAREKKSTAAAKPRGPKKDADTRAFEREVSEALGLQAEVKPGSGEAGYLVIKYGNFDQLDYLKKRLTGE